MNIEKEERAEIVRRRKEKLEKKKLEEMESMESEPYKIVKLSDEQAEKLQAELNNEKSNKTQNGEQSAAGPSKEEKMESDEKEDDEIDDDDPAEKGKLLPNSRNGADMTNYRWTPTLQEIKVTSQSKRRRTKRTNPERNKKRRERRWLLRSSIQLGLREPPSKDNTSQPVTNVDSSSIELPDISQPSSSSPIISSAESASTMVEAANPIHDISSSRYHGILPPTDPKRPYDLFNFDESTRKPLNRKRIKRRRRASRGPNLSELEIYFESDCIDEDFAYHYRPVKTIVDLVGHQSVNLDLVSEKN